jgi:integrase
VEQFLNGLAKTGVSARGQQMAVNVLGRALKDAVRLKLVASNAVRDVVKPKPAKKEMRYWDATQVKTFLRAADTDRLGALYVMAIATGMREGELFALEWTNIDWAAGSVLVQRSVSEVAGKLAAKSVKTAKGLRRIDLPEFALTALRRHRERMTAEGHQSPAVFCDEKGGWLRWPNVAQRSLRPLAKRAGLPQIQFHDLRRTAATLLLLADVNPKIVQEQLGHATVQITLDTYSHVLPTLQRVATERLDRLFTSELGGTMAVQGGLQPLAEAS